MIVVRSLKDKHSVFLRRRLNEHSLIQKSGRQARKSRGYNYLDNRPEVAVVLLKMALVVCEEPVEVMEQDPVENGPLGMSRKIHSSHAGACNRLVFFCSVAKDCRNAFKFIEQAKANIVALNPKVGQAILQLAKK